MMTGMTQVMPPTGSHKAGHPTHVKQDDSPMAQDDSPMAKAATNEPAVDSINAPKKKVVKKAVKKVEAKKPEPKKEPKTKEPKKKSAKPKAKPKPSTAKTNAGVASNDRSLAKSINVTTPQYRILKCLSKSSRPLTRKEISEKAGVDYDGLNSDIGAHDPDIRAKNDNWRPSLLTLKYVKGELHDINGRDTVIYNITSSGKATLAKASIK